MSVKIAVATSDGKNVDLHFGKAEKFQIFALQNGKFVFLEERKSVKSENLAETSSSNCASQNCGNGNGCGQSGGCGGGGCGESSGIESPNVTLLSDCVAIVASKFGKQIMRQFERKAISVFDIECPLDFVLEKLASYYKKQEIKEEK